MPREKLYKRINERVDEMFERGVIGEVGRVMKKRPSKIFKQALGIKEVNSYLKGKISLEQARELLKRNTRRYAKRQMTWFRKNSKIQWLKRGISVNIEDMVRLIA